MKNLITNSDLLTMIISNLSKKNKIKPYKLFSRLLGIFGLAMICTVSSWGDGASNYNCSNQELISELNSISATTPHTETGTLYDGSGTDDDDDYYYFTPGVAGTLSINSYESNENTDLYISTASCGDNRVINNSKSYSTSTPISVGASDTVYIRIKREKNNAKTEYILPMIFKINAPLPPTLSIASNSTTEGNSGTKTLNFTVTQSAVSGTATTVRYSTSNGTATAGSDYVAVTNQTITIPAGSTAATASVTINGDTTVEPDETFSVTLSNPTNATLGTASAIGTITNDDIAPTVSIANASTTEGNSGTKTLNFTVTQSAVSGTATTVRYSTSNGTATAGSDYVAVTNQTITIPAGSTTATAAVTINGDTTFEADETFIVTLSSPTNSTLGTASATGTITNDDLFVNSPPIIISNGGEATAAISIAANTTAVTTVQATDANNDTLSYSISGTNSAAFTINTTTGVLVLKTGASAGTTYAVTVNVSDGKGSADSQALTVTIIDVSLNFTCANPRTYSQAYYANIPGQIDIIGNSVVCKNNGSNQCSDPGNTRNNDINMMYINVDNDNATFNHSSAELNIPADSKIKWAGLYWQGMFAGPTSAQQNNSKTVKLKVPGGSYVNITSDNSKYNWVYLKETPNRWMYQGVADITNLIDVNNPNGYYEIANLNTSTGTPAGGSFGAWSIIIVYYNKDMPIRNLTVYDGYQGVMPGGNGSACNDRSGDPKDACLYAQEHSCPIDLASTGVANPISVPLTGFLTPKGGVVESSLGLFSGEGDRGASGDRLSITNKSGILSYVTNAQNPIDDVQNATISRNGIQVTTLEPQATLAGGTPWLNTLGADIDLFDVSDKLDNDQSATVITMNTSGDGYFPGVFAFSTELYQPSLCYDYAYKQNDRYFTEDNNGSYLPKIVGTGLSTSDPITVELFIQNTEISDISLSNVSVDIFDINTTQATYAANTTFVINPGEVFPIKYNTLTGIPINDIDSQDYFYLDYDLNPLTSNIDMPLNARLNYNVTFPVTVGNPINIQYETYLNTEIPLCSALNFQYSPIYGNFNVEDATLAGSENDTIGQLYNLPTQTANRPGNFKVAAYDAVNTNTRKNVSTVVAIELIDAGKFHGIDASCTEPDSALTPRVWVTFGNETDGNVSLTDFNANTIQHAIDNGLFSDFISTGVNSITSPGQFYENARENTAFRISYNRDGDGSIIQMEAVDCHPGTGTCYQILNFSEAIKYNDGNCIQDVDGNANSTDKIPQFCGNSGGGSGSAISESELAVCMECVYGFDINFHCSRDNFATRPESFRVQLKDQDQNDTTQKSFISLNNDTSIAHDSSNVSPTGYQIAAGYQYALEVNATNHENETPTPGYDASFLLDGDNDSRTFKLKWHDITNNAFCNVTEDQNKTLTFYNGRVDLNISSDQVGKYDLNLFDKLWTRVDWDSTVTTHHVGTHFLTGLDCVPNTSRVPSQSTITGVSGQNITNVSGCDITTYNEFSATPHIVESDDNTRNGAVYTDLALRVHPYKFDQSSVAPAIGPYTRTNGQTFVYIDTPPTMDANDTEMSYNMNGTFAAVGYDNSKLSNFVTGCYADDVNMDLNFTYNIPEPLITPYLSYSLKDHHTTDNSVVYRPASGTDDFEVAQHNSILTPFSIAQGEEFFAKDMNGSITMDLGYNFIRTYNQALNPRHIEFHDFNITYATNPTGVKADLDSDFQIFGNKTLDQNVTFVYGRAKPSQDFYDDVTANSILTPISTVVYCDQDPITCSAVYNLETVLSKTEEFDWYLSRGHVMTENDGNITLGSDNGATVSSPVVINNSGGVDPNVVVSDGGVTTRPLEVNIDFGATTNRWLIYNKSTNSVPIPFYRVRFIGQSDWAGHGDSGHVVGGNTNTKKNRRLGW